MSEVDQDCMIRAYLGRRRFREKQPTFFSLRSYCMHADQMEELGLDRVLYAEVMAETLTELYWKVE